MEPRPEAETSRRARRESGAGPGLLDLVFGAGRRVLADLRTLQADLLHLAKVRRDKLRVGTRSVAFGVALGALAAVFALVLLGGAAWLLLTGLAGAVAALLGSPAWLGSLVVGLLIPLAALGGLFLVQRRVERRQLAELRDEYRELERLRREARERRAQAGPESTP